MTSKPRKRAPKARKKIKRGWLLAEVVIIDHAFFVKFRAHDGITEVWPADERGAWNSNIHVGLKVYVVKHKGAVLIRDRAQNNIKFTKI